jgi:hypothetical protein
MSASIRNRELALSIVPHDRSRRHHNVSFSVVFPESLNLTEMKLLSGYSRSAGNDANCAYSVSAHVLRGNCSVLDPEQGLSVTVPIGYFTFFPSWLHVILSTVAVCAFFVGFDSIRQHTRPVRSSDQSLAAGITPAEINCLLSRPISLQSSVLQLGNSGCLTADGPLLKVHKEIHLTRQVDQFVAENLLTLGEAFDARHIWEFTLRVDYRFQSFVEYEVIRKGLRPPDTCKFLLIKFVPFAIGVVGCFLFSADPSTAPWHLASLRDSTFPLYLLTNCVHLLWFFDFSGPPLLYPNTFFAIGAVLFYLVWCELILIGTVWDVPVLALLALGFGSLSVALYYASRWTVRGSTLCRSLILTEEESAGRDAGSDGIGPEPSMLMDQSRERHFGPEEFDPELFNWAVMYFYAEHSHGADTVGCGEIARPRSLAPVSMV